MVPYDDPDTASWCRYEDRTATTTLTYTEPVLLWKPYSIYTTTGDIPPVYYRITSHVPVKEQPFKNRAMRRKEYHDEKSSHRRKLQSKRKKV